MKFTDMSTELLNIIVIFSLILANGVFAMAEIAIISTKRTRLQEHVTRGDERAEVVLTLLDDLSPVSIWKMPLKKTWAIKRWEDF